MSDHPTFTIERRLDATPEQVWAAWTDPDQAAAWWHPHGVSTPRETVEIDARPGGRYRYTMVRDDTGESFPTGGTYLEVDPPRRLVFTWADPDADPDEAPIATVEIEPDGDGAVLRFTLTRFAADGAGIRSGWDEALDVLETFLSTR